VATVQVDADGLRIKLDHPETDDLLAKLDVASIGNIGAVVALLVKFGVAAAAAPYVGGALVAHISWEAFAITMSDKGHGVVLFAPAILWTGRAPGVVIPSTRFPDEIDDARVGLTPDGGLLTLVLREGCPYVGQA
jgi:hypothetical protein